jgi:hypothetical protein
MEAPSLIEIIDNSAAALQREKAGNRVGCRSRQIGKQEKQKKKDPPPAPPYRAGSR